MRTSLRLLIVTLWTATLAVSTAASAQTTEVITYYHSDAIGSIRMITDTNGQVVERHDYMPFGEEWPASSSTDRRLYVGKERDQETGFDYSGARYYAPSSGRFTSPDPLTADAMRIVSPQRWNQYSYAANNPLTYGDPDGLDVIVINYVDGAHGAGHIGIMAVDPNTGEALYGGFNPRHNNMPADLGKVELVRFPQRSVLFQNGRPTHDSLAAVTETLAKREDQGTRIRSLYFKTSASETAALREFILTNERDPLGYYILGNNCLAFTINGLRAAGIDAPHPNETVFHRFPNVYFALTLSEMEWRMAAKPTPNVETSYCVQTERGCIP